MEYAVCPVGQFAFGMATDLAVIDALAAVSIVIGSYLLSGIELYPEQRYPPVRNAFKRRGKLDWDLQRGGREWKASKTRR